MTKRKPKLEKLSVNLRKGGELRYETAYDAHAAAKTATKWARKGWRAEVQAWNSLGTKRNVFMTCEPGAVPGPLDKYGRAPRVPDGMRVVASCTITPAFKKRITRRK